MGYQYNIFRSLCLFMKIWGVKLRGKADLNLLKSFLSVSVFVPMDAHHFYSFPLSNLAKTNSVLGNSCHLSYTSDAEYEKSLRTRLTAFWGDIDAIFMQHFLSTKISNVKSLDRFIFCLYPSLKISSIFIYTAVKSPRFLEVWCFEI